MGVGAGAPQRDRRADDRQESNAREAGARSRRVGVRAQGHGRLGVPQAVRLVSRDRRCTSPRVSAHNLAGLHAIGRGRWPLTGWDRRPASCANSSTRLRGSCRRADACQERSADMKIRRLRHVCRTAPGNARRSPRTRFEVGRADRAPAVIYGAVGCGWSLWWPCEACDGAQLPLRGRAAVHGQDCVRLPLACGIVDQPCPRCETRPKRLAPAGAEPAVWYDTWLSDWALRLPRRSAPERAMTDKLGELG